MQTILGKPLKAAYRRLIRVPASLAVAVALTWIALCAPSQTTFEVASVKPNKSGQLAMNLGRPFKGRTYTATNVALRHVIAVAYGMPVERVLGGPSWIGVATAEMRFIGGDRFDISAALPEGSSADQVPADAPRASSRSIQAGRTH